MDDNTQGRQRLEIQYSPSYPDYASVLLDGKFVAEFWTTGATTALHAAQAYVDELKEHFRHSDDLAELLRACLQRIEMADRGARRALSGATVERLESLSHALMRASRPLRRSARGGSELDVGRRGRPPTTTTS